MMISDNQIIFCIKCQNAVELCFCSCPYCGKVTEKCHCNASNFSEVGKTFVVSNKSKHSLSRQLKKSHFTNSKDDDWWRLEKCQVGSKFS